MRSRRSVLATCALALCTVPNCHLLGQAKVASQHLTGTWTLVEAEEVMRDGHRGPYPDLGPNAKGTLIYTSDGHMCVMLMRPGRALWHGEEEEATPREKIEAASGFSAYCGTYAVDERRHLIVHMPDLSFVPNLVGTLQARPFQRKGDQLTFSGTESFGPVASWRIVWRRTRPGQR